MARATQHRSFWISLLALAAVAFPAGAETPARVQVVSPPSSIQKKIDRYHRIHRLHTLRAGLRKSLPCSVSLFRPRDVLQRVSVLFQTARVEGLFKPQACQKRGNLEKMFQIRGGTATLRERAAYLTAWHLGLHRLVPQTELATQRGRRGSLQRLVPGRNLGHDFRSVASRDQALGKVPWDDVYALLVFDFVTGQRDRKPYNILLQPMDRKTSVVAIDNELSFGLSRGPLDAHAFLAAPVARLVPAVAPSARLVRRIKKVKVESWKADLSQVGLSPPEVEAAARRLEQVQRTGLQGVSTDPRVVRLWDQTARGL